jgi:hypothetical protein
MTVFFILSLLVIVGLIIFFIITRIMRKKKKGNKIKKDGGEPNSTEKEKEIVFKGEGEEEDEDEDDDDEENKKEKKKKEKSQIPKSPSTEHLLSPNVESEETTEKIESEDEREKGRREEKEKEETGEEKKEGQKKREKIDIPDSTSISMSFLVEGYGTSCSFNKVLVDLRDSLGYQLRTGIRKFTHKKRNELGIEVVYFVGRGGENMIERRIRIDS